METKLKLIECPRDAMQGIESFIPTDKKIAYINALLKCGFDTIDFGSFVSPKVVPQMKDTAEVLEGLNMSSSNSKLLAIVANQRGAQEACAFEEINYLGYPFSVSETFQKRNTNHTIPESLKIVEDIQELCEKNKKEMVLYVSMAFGNPYGDKWSPGIVDGWVKMLSRLGIKIFALSDTIGASTPDVITDLFTTMITETPELEIGAHLHTTPETWEEKIDAAYKAGCRRFDGAIKGFGGCPMAEDKLTGNMPTEKMLGYFEKNSVLASIDSTTFLEASKLAEGVFSEQ